MVLCLPYIAWVPRRVGPQGVTGVSKEGGGHQAARVPGEQAEGVRGRPAARSPPCPGQPCPFVPTLCLSTHLLPANHDFLGVSFLFCFALDHFKDTTQHPLRGKETLISCFINYFHLVCSYLLLHILSDWVK